MYIYSKYWIKKMVELDLTIKEHSKYYEKMSHIKRKPSRGMNRIQAKAKLVSNNVHSVVCEHCANIDLAQQNWYTQLPDEFFFDNQNFGFFGEDPDN